MKINGLQRTLDLLEDFEETMESFPDQRTLDAVAELSKTAQAYPDQRTLDTIAGLNEATRAYPDQQTLDAIAGLNEATRAFPDQRTLEAIAEASQYSSQIPSEATQPDWEDRRAESDLTNDIEYALLELQLLFTFVWIQETVGNYNDEIDENDIAFLACEIIAINADSIPGEHPEVLRYICAFVGFLAFIRGRINRE